MDGTGNKVNDSEAKFEYDVQKRARAGTVATFRAAVMLYIAYLGWSVIKGVREGTTTMAPWIGWTAGLFFIAAAAVFCFCIWKRWRQDLEAARLPGEEFVPAEETEDSHDGAK